MVFSGHQPQFLPYMGLIYKIFKSDVFVFDDDVQYSRTEFQSSNFIKVQGQKYKISVPVKQNFGQLINEVTICNGWDWQRKMLRTFELNYRNADHFAEANEMLNRHLYAGYDRLSDMNMAILREIVERFGIDTKLVVASEDVPTDLKKNERNIYQCEQLHGDVYFSGIGGKDYNDEEGYAKHGIRIVYSDYTPVQYKQQGKEFVENLSCLDYIANEGFAIPENWHKSID